MREISETLRSTFRRAFGLENRRTAVRPGRLDRIAQFKSEILGNARDVVVYLPAGYDEHPERRYPVLYMHDGQNLFEAERAFVPGNHWRLGEAADQVIGNRTAEPMIIVGVDNAGESRIDEYTPTHDPDKKAGGRAAEYARMMIEELKPLIDTRYRTIPDAGHTAIGGSSLGGLNALYLVLHHPEVFSRAAVMSPSVWWHGRVILRDLQTFSGRQPRLWVDIGGREGSEALEGARALRDALRARGWANGETAYREDRRGDHSERAWAARSRPMLEFLFPPVQL
jgi:predicted alpha/beta superfamily hydrolase